jgi:V8-like Glu-specific endopeptidase
MGDSGRERGPAATGRAARSRGTRAGGIRRHVAGRWSRLAWPVAVALLLWAAAAAIPATSAAEPSSRPASARLVTANRAAAARRPVAAHHPAAGQGPAVGALFYQGLGSAHFCTATVVHSPAQDLIITAAHCVDPGGRPRHFVFAPGYRDGRAPYGVWAPRRVIVDAAWAAWQDPADDVAFAVMSPSHRKNIGEVVAGENVAQTAGYHGPVRVIGYPDAAGSPVACDNAFSDDADGLVFDCPGFTDGTSGGPWIAGLDPRSGAARIIGLIGGYQQGGTTPSVSYSPVFAANVTNLYRQAVSAGGG